MAFEFTPDSLADALAPFMDERPTVTVRGDELIVGDPLSLVVAISAPIPTAFEVRCFQRVDGLPYGAACIAANRMNFSEGGARVRLLPMEDHLVVMVENGVCGPVVVGEEFALAIQSVIDGVHAFGIEARRYLASREVAGRVDELSAMAVAGSPVAEVAEAESAVVTPLRSAEAPAAGPSHYGYL